MEKIRLSDFKDKQIHFIGIGGSSMSGLAELLIGQGYRVRGDDRVESHSTEKLRREGVEVIIGHAAQNVHGAGLVVYTAAIAEDFQNTFPLCEEITWRKCRNTKLWQRLLQAALRLFSPLM